MRLCPIPCSLLIISFCCPPADVSSAQELGRSGPRVGLFGGVTGFVGEFGESNHFSVGPALQVFLEDQTTRLGLSVSHWPDANAFRMTSLHLEMAQGMANTRLVTPFLELAVGHTWAEYLASGPAVKPEGGSAAVGLGIQLEAGMNLRILSDLRLRTDGGGWNGEWRTLAGFSKGGSTSTADKIRWSGSALWLKRLRGPWKSSGTGIGFSVDRAVAEQLRSVQSMYLIHWRTRRRPEAGGHRWDTRGVLAIPQAQWASPAYPRLRLRGGPVVSMMGEGPDNGVRPGGHLEAQLGSSFRGVFLALKVGWFWILRSGSDDPRDQHAISFGAGIGS